MFTTLQKMILAKQMNFSKHGKNILKYLERNFQKTVLFEHIKDNLSGAK